MRLKYQKEQEKAKQTKKNNKWKKMLDRNLQNPLKARKECGNAYVEVPLDFFSFNIFVNRF